MFSLTIQQLQKADAIDINTIEEILPSIYTGIQKGSFKVKISSVTTIEIKVENEDEERDPKKAIEKSIANDLWR